MSSKTKAQKFLIIGGGVGGCSLAIHLIRLGKDITLIDQGINKSSIVAAGLINPLVFRRMTKSWRADELLPYAEKFYSALEKDSQGIFYHPITIRRFFSSEQEFEFWKEKQVLPEFKNYMHELDEEDLNYSAYNTKNDFGSGRVKQAAWVNTPLFIKAAHHFIAQNGQLFKNEFVYSELDAATGNYRGELYDKIIFAEGYQSRHNPWFNFLPVQSTKGEVLTAVSDQLPPDESINRKCFVLPTGNGQYRIGATYSWNAEAATITEEGKKEILDKLAYLTDVQPKVVDQLAGIRPTSPDRRPIMGQHPELKRLYIFNGLGTKGYMIAPLLSLEFSEHLLNETSLAAEVDLKRFNK